MDSCKISNLYTLSETMAAELFTGLTYPWEALPQISGFICELGKTLDPQKYVYPRKRYCGKRSCGGQLHRA